MEEKASVISDYGVFTQEDLDNLSVSLSLAAKKDEEYRKERLKEMKDNEKALSKRSKELNKRIPFELAYYSYLSINKRYVGSEFVEKYKEWL